MEQERAMQEGSGTDWRGPYPTDMEYYVVEDDSQLQASTEIPRPSGSSAKPAKERPCDACRRRKTRCVKENCEEKCVLCKFHSQECTYLHEPIARNRKRKAVAPSDGKGKGNGSSNRKGKGSGVHTPAAGSAGPLVTDARPGIEEYDGLLKKTLGLQTEHHSHLVGLTEPFSFPRFSLSRGTSEKTTQGGTVTVRKVDCFNAFTIHEDQGTFNYEGDATRVEAIQNLVKPHGPELVDLYFRIVHPSFPILHKGLFHEKYARSYREFSPSILAAVYLLSTNYWTHSTTLAGKPKPDASLLWRLAIESFDHTIYRPKLASVQAGLLLAQYESTDTDVVNSGSRGRLTAHLISIAHKLGLHMDPSGWDIPTWEISLRCRLAWALYMQDKWVALIEGRPPLISDTDWMVPTVQAHDFPEFEEFDEEGSSEVEKGRVVFMQMIELTRILSDVLTSVFALRSHHEIQKSSNPLAALLERVRPLQVRLKNWSVLVHDVIRLENAAAMKLTSSGYLRLAYLSVEVSIHRRIICQTLACDADPNFVAVCRMAAQQKWLDALDFVGSLKAQHLTSFWYFCSAACLSLLISFGSLLLGSSQELTQRQFFLNKLKEFRWQLKINGEVGAKFMKAALKSMILDPKEIFKPEVFNIDAPTSATSASGSTVSFSPQTSLENMSLRTMPNQVTVGPPTVPTNWAVNQQNYSEYLSNIFMPIQPHIVGYDWTQTTFGPSQSGGYTEDS